MVKREVMELKEAYGLLKEAYDEYSLATFYHKTAKGERKKSQQQDVDMIYGMVKNIFSSCPELYNYVELDFFEYPWFESDFGGLIEKLEEELGKPQAQ